MGACYEGSLLLVKRGGAAGFGGGVRGGRGGLGFQRGEGGGSYGCGVLCVGCVVKEHDVNPQD